jgi:hypothetical protein
MITICLMLAFGLIGSVIGDHWFDGSVWIGASIGASIGLLFRILFIGGRCGRGGSDFCDIGDFGGSSFGD